MFCHVHPLTIILQLLHDNETQLQPGHNICHTVANTCLISLLQENCLDISLTRGEIPKYIRKLVLFTTCQASLCPPWVIINPSRSKKPNTTQTIYDHETEEAVGSGAGHLLCVSPWSSQPVHASVTESSTLSLFRQVRQELWWYLLLFMNLGSGQRQTLPPWSACP